MSRTKDQWIEETGGFRIGETPEQFSARVTEIAKLEADFKSGRIKLDDVDRLQRRLCELKGIDYDAPDDDRDD